LRASAVIGLRCPDAGKLTNPIFIVTIPSLPIKRRLMFGGEQSFLMLR
jgi:hypothetical protein